MDDMTNFGYSFLCLPLLEEYFGLNEICWDEVNSKFFKWAKGLIVISKFIKEDMNLI